MRDWKSFAGVTLIFLLGGAAGALVSLAFVHHRTAAVLQRGSLAYEQLLEHRLSRGLALDDGQRERFHQAFMTNIEERKKIQEQVQPQMRALNIQTAQEIRTLLSPGQLKIFRRNLADFRRQYGSPPIGGAGIYRPEAAPAGITSTNSAPPPDSL